MSRYSLDDVVPDSDVPFGCRKILRDSVDLERGLADAVRIAGAAIVGDT